MTAMKTTPRDEELPAQSMNRLRGKECGQCGWYRHPYCRNPSSPKIDQPVGKAGIACWQFAKIFKRARR
jgi:hypothetical protein